MCDKCDKCDPTTCKIASTRQGEMLVAVSAVASVSLPPLPRVHPKTQSAIERHQRERLRDDTLALRHFPEQPPRHAEKQGVAVRVGHKERMAAQAANR